MTKISDKVIVITGGTKGIGKGFADSLNVNGNTVIVLSRAAEDNGITSFPCDVSDKGQVEDVFNRIAGLYGHIDILINNAGYGVSGATEMLSEDVVRGIFDVNCLGVLFCSQAALKFMPSGSRIYNISSVSAYTPMPFRTLYSVSKAAVNMLSCGMRVETAPFGVDICCLCFGDIKTEFLNHRIMASETNERYGGRVEAADEFAAARQLKNKKMPVEKAVAKAVRVMGNRNTRPVYILGVKYKLAYALFKLTSLRFTTYLVSKVFIKKR